MPHADDVNDQNLVGDRAGDAVVADADSAGVIGAGEFGAAGLGARACPAPVSESKGSGASLIPSSPKG